MISKRIICCLDVREGRVVKGVNFLSLRDAGDPVEMALLYNATGADEVVFLDITASSDKRSIIIDLVKQVAEVLFIPFCVGGGIRTFKDAKIILSEGADKVAINTEAFKNPKLLTEISQIFGSQCLVCSIDSKFNGKFHEVYLHGGRTATGKSTVEWAREAVLAGAGEILLTSIDRDGTKNGFDLDLLSRIRKVVQVPVIASGGAGNKDHFIQAFNYGADAVLAASVFHYGEKSISDIKKHLKKHKISVRPVSLK